MACISRFAAAILIGETELEVVIIRVKWARWLKRQDGPGSIPGVGVVEIFLHSFMSRLALGSTQPPIK